MNNVQKINELINKVGSYQKKAMINLQKNNFQQAQLQFTLLARSADELSIECKLLNKEKSDDVRRTDARSTDDTTPNGENESTRENNASGTDDANSVETTRTANEQSK